MRYIFCIRSIDITILREEGGRDDLRKWYGHIYGKEEEGQGQKRKEKRRRGRRNDGTKGKKVLS